MSQNLIPNPSFEDTLAGGCPTGYPDLDGKCANWLSFRGTPDYMNNCSSVCGYYNQYGHQTPHSGQAYAGFGNYQITLSNLREHIGVQLTSALVVGTKYYLSFYVSSAYTYLYINIASNKTGATLTTYQYSDPNMLGVLPNTSMIYSDSIITDTLNWIKISGSFIADSAYQYLIIGSFYDDNNIDTLNLPYQVVPQASYQYLDDVCLSTDSLYCEIWTGLSEQFSAQNQIQIYPNPASNFIHIKTINEIERIQIVNSIGQILFVLEGERKANAELSLEFLSSGLYYLQIKTKKEFNISVLNIIH